MPRRQPAICGVVAESLNLFESLLGDYHKPPQNSCLHKKIKDIGNQLTTLLKKGLVQVEKNLHYWQKLIVTKYWNWSNAGGGEVPRIVNKKINKYFSIAWTYLNGKFWQISFLKVLTMKHIKRIFSKEKKIQREAYLFFEI